VGRLSSSAPFFPHENRPPRHEEPRFLEDDPSSTKNGSWESREGCYIIVVNVNRLLAKKESSEEGRMRGPFGPQDPDPDEFRPLLWGFKGVRCPDEGVVEINFLNWSSTWS
jgi:hypothetical protein